VHLVSLGSPAAFCVNRREIQFGEPVSMNQTRIVAVKSGSNVPRVQITVALGAHSYGS
jgi:hypothetical protein